MTLGSTGVLVGRYRIYDVAAKEDKRSGDVFRKVVLEVGEVRVVHDYLERKKLLVDLGFEDTGDVIAATASPALPPAGVDPDTGEVASDLEELESVDG